MKTKFIIGLLALAFAYGCTAKKAAASDSVAVAAEPVKEKLVITREVLAEGKSLYGMNCAKCHELFNPNSFTPQEWTPIVLRMQKKAKISDEQREKIYAYLTTPQM
ncbi:cytochrome c [Flavobacterium sp. F372]|uniref:Cytochrome c n=1 Tax=Flavobacterium bernardetii TaxID=2813823 RepID=A0ABR7IVP1_9FLAO|nr:cytochrome c [Flavobacterium bernardetii]MBC5833846.1 cytochrome c [Flavobacterium bernardetii]NHF69079.1 cytochrome c [Flavobacterium bernardetii]